MPETLILDLRLAAFAVVAVAGVVLWYRHRGRPAAYLAASLLLLCTVAGLARPAVSPLGEITFPLLVLAIMAIPWLLAAFAWSFEGPLPRWLRLAALPLAGLALVPGLMLRDEPERTGADGVLVLAFALAWAAVAVTAAVRLWTAGPVYRTVRARMRLLAAGTALLAVTILAAGVAPDGAPQTGGRIASIVAAGVYLAGFAPPKPLRLWWRHRALVDFVGIESDLAAATTAGEVARIAMPRLAHLMGSNTALVTRDGEVLAASGITDDDAARIAKEDADEHGYRAHLVGHAIALVETTPYSPLLGAEEQALVTHVLGNLHLALERARLFEAHRAAVRAAQEAKAELETSVYGLAHDLKNPTIALAGLAELLPETRDEAERDELIHQMRWSAAWVHQLVEALLEISRVGRTLIETETVDLEAVAMRVAERVRQAAPRARIAVDGPLPLIDANPVRVEQLFDNLVTNAIRHGGREDVTVTITGEHDGDEVFLKVGDDGAGVSEGDRERIFELFQRGSRGVSRGSGVGLALVRRIAESYGGAVELADSETGAAFVVRLPSTRLVNGAA